MDLTFHLLEQITNNFSADQKIGSGGYGEVYKGVHDGKVIAVKKLFIMHGIDDTEFTNEFRNLMKVEHPNIIRLIAYCHEVRKRHLEVKGEYVFSNIIERLLCFEYMEGGSLANHITDESCGFDWLTRYKIIKGICEGLNHLHNGRSYFIYHLDLKPDNILLDKNKIPRIADFGMSRLLASSKTHITQTSKGTTGYMPPEFIQARRITKKYDVFSVGVIIIEILAGAEGYNNFCEMSSPHQFIEFVHENWKKRLHTMPMQENTSHKIDFLAVRRCIELAVRCVEAEPAKRPSIIEVIAELNKLDEDMKKISHMSQETSGSKDLEVDPSIELRFPFELNKDISCCMQLTNKTDNYIAFNIKINKTKYCARPNSGTIAPYSKLYITLILRAQEKAPFSMRCDDMFFVQSTRLGPESCEIMEDFIENAMESMAVDEVKLPIVYVM